MHKHGLIFACNFALLFFCAVQWVSAQIATGAPYTLKQAVISSGGGRSADAGNLFSVTGTIGQPAAGSRSAGAPFNVYGGFFTSQAAATNASVTVGGRVTASDGRGIRHVLVTMTGTGGESRTIVSTAFGYFRFTDVPAGDTYIFTVRAKRFIFKQSTIVRFVAEETEDVLFVAQN